MSTLSAVQSPHVLFSWVSQAVLAVTCQNKVPLKSFPNPPCPVLLHVEQTPLIFRSGFAEAPCAPVLTARPAFSCSLIEFRRADPIYQNWALISQWCSSVSRRCASCPAESPSVVTWEGAETRAASLSLLSHTLIVVSLLRAAVCKKVPLKNLFCLFSKSSHQQ